MKLNNEDALIYLYLHKLSLYSVLLPLVVGLINYKYLEVNSKFVLLILLFASISQLSPEFYQNKAGNWLIYNVYTIIDTLFWGLIFWLNQKSATIRTFIFLIWLSHLSISLYFFYQYGIAYRFYYELVCLDSLVQVVWVLTFFYSIYYNENNKRLEYYPMFWFSMGVLLYTPSTYFLFAYYSQIRLSLTREYQYLWRLHDLMNGLLYVSLSIGMWVNRYRFKKNIYEH